MPFFRLLFHFSAMRASPAIARLTAGAFIVLCGLAGSHGAEASEISELMDCFRAIQSYSDGAGDDIGNLERETGNTFQTIVLSGQRGRTKGFYLFSESEAYFLPLPASEQAHPTAMWSSEFRIPGPGRGAFQCTLDWKRDTSASSQPRCRYAYNDTWHYERTNLVRVPARENPANVLRTAVALRLNGMPYRFRGLVNSYEEGRREACANSQKGFLDNFVDSFKRKPRPSYPPSQTQYFRAAQTCAQTEDEYLRSTAQSAMTGIRQSREASLILCQDGVPQCISR